MKPMGEGATTVDRPNVGNGVATVGRNLNGDGAPDATFTTRAYWTAFGFSSPVAAAPRHGQPCRPPWHRP
jgi:hypothetical protein